MKNTIFTTPIISSFFRLIANSILRMTGWNIEGQLPDIPKFILVGAPHTSNWDFLLFLGAIFHLKANVKFITRFYHIAKNAEIQMVMAIVDGKKKALRVGQVFNLTDEYGRRYKKQCRIFSGMAGINPRKNILH
ncbi:hypothetical protein [Candidatus Villigracilis saccharophilus]|uniref:hypothetical protein n=1 Tax=Candidatus Villigracilis saccharophilus TaxID=3140684 RepID=UPI003134E9CC|nr:hypothetical protein [Anaerolineales bacterium]